MAHCPRASSCCASASTQGPQSLIARATPSQARDIESARRRLLDSREMGTLFKALALAAPGLPPPPGFADPS